MGAGGRAAPRRRRLGLRRWSRGRVLGALLAAGDAAGVLALVAMAAPERRFWGRPWAPASADGGFPAAQLPGACGVMDTEALGPVRPVLFAWAFTKLLRWGCPNLRTGGAFVLLLGICAVMDTVRTAWLVRRAWVNSTCCGAGTAGLTVCLAWLSLVGWAEVGFTLFLCAQVRSPRRRGRRGSATGDDIEKGLLQGRGGYESDDSEASFYSAGSEFSYAGSWFSWTGLGGGESSRGGVSDREGSGRGLAGAAFPGGTPDALEGFDTAWEKGLPASVVAFSRKNLVDTMHLMQDEGAWQLTSQSRGAKVWRMPRPNEPTILISWVEMRVSCEELCAYISDTRTRSEWDNLCDFAVDFRQYNHNSKVMRVKFKKKFMVAPRDIVVFSHVSHAPDGSIWAWGFDVPEEFEEWSRPHDANVVRADILRAAYNVRPLPGGGCEVFYISQADKKNLPEFANELSGKWAAMSVADIRDLLHKR